MNGDIGSLSSSSTILRCRVVQYACGNRIRNFANVLNSFLLLRKASLHCESSRVVMVRGLQQVLTIPLASVFAFLFSSSNVICTDLCITDHGI